MTFKHQIDAFKKNHTDKLNQLKALLGINVSLGQFEQIIKSKPHSREFNAAKEHREFFQQTENLHNQSKVLEEKIKVIRANIAEDQASKANIQENFSQNLYAVQRKI